MADVIILSCPNCDTKLIIKNAVIKQFICNTCGQEYLIKREGGITYLEKKEQTTDYGEQYIKSNSFEDEDFSEVTEDNLESVNLHTIDRVITESLADDKSIAEQIDNKISNLQILQNEIQQQYAKSKVTYTVLCLVTLAIIYAIFPIFDSYNDLFIAIGITFVPIIIGFVIYFLINRKAAQSNYHFIETVIINLRKERDSQV